MTDLTPENLARLDQWTPERVETLIRQEAAAYESSIPGITNTMLSLANTESRMGRNMVGPAINKGMHSGDKAIGPFQYMAATAKTAGIDRFDVAANVKQAVRDITANTDRFGDIRLAVAAHHTGPNREEYLRGEIPDTNDGYSTTKQYVQNVMDGAAAYETSTPAAAAYETSTPVAATASTDGGTQPVQAELLQAKDIASLFKLPSIPGSVGGSGAGFANTGVSPASAAISAMSGPAKRNSALWNSIRSLFEV